MRSYFYQAPNEHVVQKRQQDDRSDKNDNFKNILGYNLLLNLMPSVNNIVKTTTTPKNGAIGTTINLYEYNSKGYPVTKMVDVVNGKPFSTVKYQY